MKHFILLFIGLIFTLLGLLWFLQGIGVLNMAPILCFADCEPVVGGSPVWAIVGALFFVAGLITFAKSFKSSL
jgi:hypothetical protein